MADRLLSLPEAGERLGRSRWTVRRLINKKQLKAVSIGAGDGYLVLRVRESTLEAFMKSRTV